MHNNCSNNSKKARHKKQKFEIRLVRPPSLLIYHRRQRKPLFGGRPDASLLAAKPAKRSGFTDFVLPVEEASPGCQEMGSGRLSSPYATQSIENCQSRSSRKGMALTVCGRRHVFLERKLSWIADETHTSVKCIL